MRVCHITTFWPNRFGHTHYTDALIRGIQTTDPTRHYIAAECPALSTRTEEFDCEPCWHRQDDYVADISKTVNRIRAEIALVQYTNDLFGADNRFIHLLESLEGLGVRTVVNTHSVYPCGRSTRYIPGRDSASFDLSMADVASCVQVHSTRMKRDLISRGVAEKKICIIPHGTLIRQPEEKFVARERLGIPANAKVVLFFGFIWLGKGLDFLIDVFSSVVEQLPDAFLYIGGHTRVKDKISLFYMNCLKARIETLHLGERVGLWGDYVPEEIVPVMYGAADVIALPYRQDYSSVSGVVHQAAGMDRVMVGSNIAKFDEVDDSISRDLVVEQFSRTDWAKILVRLLSDQRFHDEMLARVRQFAANTSWEKVGKKHLELYRRLMEGRQAAE